MKPLTIEAKRLIAVVLVILAAGTIIAIMAGCAGESYARETKRSDGTKERVVVTPHFIPGTNIHVFDTTVPDGGVDWWAIGENLVMLALGGPAVVLGAGAVKSQRVRSSIKRGHIQTALGWKHTTKSDKVAEAATNKAENVTGTN